MFGFWHKLEVSSRLLGPGLLSVIFVLISATPMHIQGLSEWIPLFTMMAIYYWGLYRPALMPYWFVFALGLMQDALFGMPLGVSSFLNLLFRFLVVQQGRMFAKEAFWALWFGFALLSVIIFLLYWTLITLITSRPMPVETATVQWMMTVGLYPLVHQLFNLLYKTLPPR